MPRIESVAAEPMHDRSLVNVITGVRNSDGVEDIQTHWLRLVDPVETHFEASVGPSPRTA